MSTILPVVLACTLPWLSLFVGMLLGQQAKCVQVGHPSGKRKTSNLILLALGGFLLAFIVAMTVIFCVKGSVPDTLIQYTLGAGGVEAFLCAGITVSKVITGGKPGESEDTYD